MTYFLTLIFMLLVFWRPQEWLFPWMYGWPVLSVIVYVSLLGLLLESGQGTVRFPKTPAVKLAVGLWVAVAMSHIVHGYFQGMIDAVIDTFKPCLFLVLILVVVNSIRRLQGVVLVLLVGALLMSVHAVLQMQTGVGFAGCLPLKYYYGFKEKWVQQSLFFGIFSDPNDLGQFLATCIPLIFALPKRLGFIAMVLALAVIGLLSEGIISTQSRGTVIGVSASVFCLVFMRLPAKWLPYVAALSLIGGLVICAIWGGSLLDESAQDRVGFWGNANRYFKSHPVFGGGFGMFGEIAETGGAVAHNAYVTCYTELGLFGYWIWFNMLTLGIIGCWRTRVAFISPKNNEQAFIKRIAGVSIAAMVGYAASAYFISRAFTFPCFFMFGLLNAIPMVAARYLPEDHPPLIDYHRDVLFTGTFCALGSVVYIYVTILLLNRGA